VPSQLFHVPRTFRRSLFSREIIKSGNTRAEDIRSGNVDSAAILRLSMSPDEIDLVLFNRNTSIHLEEGINVLDQVLGQQLEQDLRHAQMKHLIKQEYLEDEIFNSGQSTPAQSPARSSGNESCSLTPRRVKGGHYDHYKDTSGKINLELISDEMERARVEAKRVKNREAAAKSRAKKKKQTEALEKKVGTLRAATTEVTDEVVLLRDQASTLRAILDEHERLCGASGDNESD